MNTTAQRASEDGWRLRTAIMTMTGRYGDSERGNAYANARGDYVETVRTGRAADRRYRAIQRLTLALLAMTVEEGAR